MDLAAVLADATLAEQRIVGRHLLHLGDHLRRVVALQRLDGLQVMQHGRVDARLDHGGHVALVLRGEALREGARCVVAVPGERLGEDQALRRLQAERMHVRDEHQQPGEVLPALDDAELGRLLDRVDRIAAGIGEADDLGLGGLRLQ